ncbi:uncharacterized protein BYT42DRAFT_588823 [Radiomyces spectabilis]|uniref:uncharacterized protein n=1 Tax=Radiomyces spectabilis TaxID=64574 RepID=UPI00221EE188|nr:uncharacterized protein BYT42DRAFT_588823 [Radiomyces spectabilis]KAI8366078.1 hypothetical protein BYT42DRAFT_588823 [Radiomyces spectabilis]
MAKDKVTKKNQVKKMSPYNKFIKEELPKIKSENPGLSHKEAFKKAAQQWATSPENPKNNEGKKAEEEPKKADDSKKDAEKTDAESKEEAAK